MIIKKVGFWFIICSVPRRLHAITVLFYCCRAGWSCCRPPSKSRQPSTASSSWALWYSSIRQSRRPFDCGRRDCSAASARNYRYTDRFKKHLICNKTIVFLFLKKIWQVNKLDVNLITSDETEQAAIMDDPLFYKNGIKCKWATATHDCLVVKFLLRFMYQFNARMPSIYFDAAASVALRWLNPPLFFYYVKSHSNTVQVP